MTDITTRLRQRLITHWIQGTGETPHASGYSVDKECNEAATEIERLRAALAELLACHTESAGWSMSMVANRAEFDAMLQRSQERLDAAVDAARAALGAAP